LKEDKGPLANLPLPASGRPAGAQPGRREPLVYCFGAGLFEPADELPGAVVLPLEGAPAPPPAEGEVLGVAGRVEALEPLPPDEPLWLEPELSHAASESAESTAAAINHLCFITRSIMGVHAHLRGLVRLRRRATAQAENRKR
jgi:hypothetical protein